MSKHTPGPWSVHPFYPGHVVPSAHTSRKVGGAGDPEVDLREYAQVIVWVDPVHRHRSHDEQVANARLIAAAPDLLAALLALVNHPGEYRDGSATDLWANAYLALTKATQP